MPSRISEILAILGSGEDGGSSVYDILSRIFEGLDQRLAVIENVSSSLAALQEQLATSSQGVVDAALAPVLASITARTDLGAILTASSVSEQTVGTGTKTFVLAPEASWPMFAPAHILSISAADDPLVYMYGRKVSYDPEIGTLVIDVLASAGAGTLSSWTIAPGSLSTMASALAVASAGEEITGPTLQIALTQIAEALSARQPLDDNLTALAELTFAANRVIGTGTDGAPDLFPVTAFGKTLLSIASGDLLRTGIGAAPLASPGFTGTPTAPTAPITSDSNQIVNVTALRLAVAALVNSSPAALDTLAEFAAALGNDANFGTTITNALAGKQPLAAVLTSLAAAASGSNKLDFVGALGPVHGGVSPTPSSAGVGLSDGNFNTITVGGVYTISGTWSNGPGATGTHTGILIVTVRPSYNGVWQEFCTGENRRWRRYSSNGTSWGNWKYLATEAVGTVGQSDGVPTGAIIERGSNANGDYVKFADGTMIAWARVVQSGAVDVVAGSLFGSANQTWVFPVAFMISPAPVASVTRCGSSSRWGVVVSNTGTSASTRVLSTVSSPTDLVIDTLAIGRWF